MSSSPPRAPAPPASSGGANTGRSSGARSETWTVGELLRWTHEKLASSGIGNARVDAEHLLAHALGCSRMQLYVEHDRPVDDEPRARFREYVRRRLAREPVAYIEGRRGFHALGLELEVDRRVLVPRPETEHLVDWVLEDLRDVPGPRVLDVGTGSGAIALAIHHGRREAEVIAVDVSDEALAVARSNAERLSATVTFVRSDLLADLDVPAGGFHAVAANLPYIASAELATLEPEVVQFEPRLALDGGDDGLRVIARLLAQLGERDAVMPGGAVYLEVGAGQAATVVEWLRALGWDADLRHDYARIARVVRGRRPGPSLAVPPVVEPPAVE